MSDFTPLESRLGRVWLIEGRARPDRQPSYESTMKMMGVDQPFGDRTDIEIPDPAQAGAFKKVGKTRGQVGPVTTSLVGRYALDLKSELLRLARKGCSLDLQYHLGQCVDPSDFNDFQKALVLEDIVLTNFGTDDLGALASDENALVNETGEISGREQYEVLPLTFSKRAGDIITNEILAVVFCDAPSCGECAEESDGGQKAFGISSAAGGSPSTPADVIFTLDGGVSWYAHDIEDMDPANDPDDIACFGGYVVVASEAEASLFYADKDDFDGSTDPDFTPVTTGIVAGGEPRALATVPGRLFAVGAGGYIYTTQDITAGLTVVDAGVATVSVLNDVHALSENFAVAVGNSGVVVFTQNGSVWGLAPSLPVGVGVNLNCVQMLDTDVWIVGTNDGRLFYTVNGGVTWTEKSFPGSGTGVVQDIDFATESVGYFSHTTAATVGRVLRTYNGGYSWKVLPEGAGNLPAADRFTAIAACPYDANKVLAGGLDDNGTDGILLLGTD